MHRHSITDETINSSFLSCEKDTELILRKLFIESKTHGDMLKRLLVVQAPDALDGDYDMSKYTLPLLLKEQYITTRPLIKMPEHDQIKAFIGLHFDDFTASSNPEFRDNMIYFEVVCHHDHWYLGNYRQRPFKILGYIDGILNKAKLTGIGELHLVGCKKYIIDEHWTAFTLSYLAVHGSDDQIPNEE